VKAALSICLLVGALAACADTMPRGSPADGSDGHVLMRMSPPASADALRASSVTCLLPAQEGTGTNADAFYLRRGPGLLCAAYGRGEISREAYRAALQDYAALALVTYASAALRALPAEPATRSDADQALAALADRTAAAQTLCRIAATTPGGRGEVPAQAPTWCGREPADNLR